MIHNLGVDPDVFAQLGRPSDLLERGALSAVAVNIYRAFSSIMAKYRGRAALALPSRAPSAECTSGYNFDWVKHFASPILKLTPTRSLFRFRMGRGCYPTH